MTPTRRLAWMAASVLVAIGLVVVWHVASAQGWVSPIFLPAPEAAWAALLEGMRLGELGPPILGTVRHMLYGWLLASLIGVLLGSVIGISPLARTYAAPMLEWFRPLPASAVFPVAIAFVGLSESMVLFVISFGALWPTLLATVQGFAGVEPRLYEVASALRMGRIAVIRKIALPNALPDILAGMRLSLTVALILSVTGEILASSDGLGVWLQLKARAFRSSDVFAGVIVLSLLGFVSAQALALIEKRVLRWRSLAR